MTLSSIKSLLWLKQLIIILPSSILHMILKGLTTNPRYPFKSCLKGFPESDNCSSFFDIFCYLDYSAKL